jgi:hypothetical protein
MNVIQETFKSGKPPMPDECEHGCEVPSGRIGGSRRGRMLELFLRRRPLEWAFSLAAASFPYAIWAEHVSVGG